MMSKAQMLLKEIIFVHHPDFVGQAHTQKIVYAGADWVNTERLIEHTMAHVGGYNFIDGDHEDFDDGTDSKTASVRLNPVPKGSQQGHILEISGIGRGGAGGSLKKGALRVVLYNPVAQRLDYFFIPKAAWAGMLKYHPTSGIAKIVATWNSKTDTCNKLDPFKVSSFEELARMPACPATQPAVIVRRFA